MTQVLCDRQLSLFCLSYAGVCDAGLKQLSALTCLTYLNLDSRQFSDTGLKHIKGLTNLVVLDLFAAKCLTLGVAT